MASNHGLYHDDSDTESITNQLSPTDGYFNQRSHPQDLMVPDPSQQTAEADKAREARAEEEALRLSEASAASRSQPQFTPQSTPSRRRLDPSFEIEESPIVETTPLIPAAPPSYSVATNDSAYHSRSGSYASVGRSGGSYNGGYNTMGRPDRAEVYVPNENPDSLSHEPLLGHAKEEQRGWRDYVREWFPKDFESFAKSLLVLVALMIGIGFIADAIVNMQHRKDSTLPHPVQPGKDELPGNAPLSCPSGIHTASANFSFTHPTNFTFVEFVRRVDLEPGDAYSYVSTSGEMHIRPATDHLEANIRVDIKTYFSDYILLGETRYYSSSDDTLQVYTPSHIPTSSASHPDSTCMYMVVDIWISPGQVLTEFALSTQTMSVTVHDGVSMRLDRFGAWSGSGSITVADGGAEKLNLDSRIINFETESGSIRGLFPLYDELNLKSKSGSIHADVEPKPASDRHPHPAKLSVHTMSGTITVDTPSLALADKGAVLSAIPSRDYRSEIGTVSGSVKATIVHGSSTNLFSTSGRIKSILTPYGSPTDRSDLTVKDESGSIDVRVLSSLTNPGDPMRKFYSDYSYTSGNLQLYYPWEWEGKLEGSVLDGSVIVNWPDMHVESRRIGVWKKVNGVKGDGSGLLKFRGISGSARLEAPTRPSDHYDLGHRWPHTGGDENHEPEQRPTPEGPELGGAPPRWPGYQDEWDFEMGEEDVETEEVEEEDVEEE